MKFQINWIELENKVTYKGFVTFLFYYLFKSQISLFIRQPFFALDDLISILQRTLRDWNQSNRIFLILLRSLKKVLLLCSFSPITDKLVNYKWTAKQGCYLCNIFRELSFLVIREKSLLSLVLTNSPRELFIYLFSGI